MIIKMKKEDLNKLVQEVVAERAAKKKKKNIKEFLDANIGSTDNSSIFGDAGEGNTEEGNVTKKKVVKEVEGAGNHYVVRFQSAKSGIVTCVIGAGSGSQARQAVVSSVKGGNGSVGPAYKLAPNSYAKFMAIMNTAKISLDADTSEEPNKTFERVPKK